MAEEVKVLKKALAEFRSGRQTRARVDSLDNAMQTVRRAFPAAFDPANEKINDEEEEAMSLYRQCKGALQSSVSTQATRKRGRGAASSEAKSETETAIRKKKPRTAMTEPQGSKEEEAVPMVAVPMDVDKADDPFHWSVEEVVKWALKLGIDNTDASKLKQQKIAGKSLASMTRKDFERYGIPGGPASDLFDGVKMLFPERFPGAVAIGIATQTNLWMYLLHTPAPAIDAVVTLPGDCNWLDEEPGSKSRPMLIRKSFVKIFDSIMASVSDRTVRGYVTLGNPGVGKSRFLSYCLWRCARNGKRAFFESVAHGAVWSFEPSGQVFARDRGSNASFPFQTTEDDFYLFDPYGDQPDEPRGCPALTIVANPIHYKGFRKREGCGVRFFMPVWSEEELELFRKKTKALEVAELHSRFSIFGGIPRYIFKSQREFLHAKSELDVAIIEGSSGSPHVLRAAVGKMENGNEISHKLIHYKVDEKTYENAVVRYASPYVERELPLKAPANRLKDLGKVLCDVADTQIVMEGQIFEEYLHRMIPLGVTMVARSLQLPSSNPVEITFAMRNVDFFDDTAGITRALQAKSYIRPNKTNYTAIDAVSWLGDRVVFLQYTRSTKHEISMDQLTFYNDLVAVKNIDKSQKICFYFVVPFEEYQVFKLQKIHVPTEATNKGKPNGAYVADMDKKVKFVEDNLEQWVAALKFD